MSLKNYGVLKGRPVHSRMGQGTNSHYQIQIVDDTTDYRIAINVQSKESPSELLYLVDDHFQHPVLGALRDLPLGFRELPRKPGGMALDFIRGNLFDRQMMRTLAGDIPGPDNDLNEAIDRYVSRALADEDALIYAFGERWGPEKNKKDKYFGFLPGNGIHDIHMNQGNSPAFASQDGVWQDGAMLVYLPAGDQWVGIFLKFQSQAWHTDDSKGHAIGSQPPVQPVEPVSPSTPGVPAPVPAGEPDLVVRIVAAMVNPVGPAPERESVTLLNTSSQAVDLSGWSIADKLKNKQLLSGTLNSGAVVTVPLTNKVQLGNGGGIITLLNKDGLKVHGVSYTKEQVRREGWTIVF